MTLRSSDVIANVEASVTTIFIRTELMEFIENALVGADTSKTLQNRVVASYGCRVDSIGSVWF